jgi:hypothetical protein
VWSECEEAPTAIARLTASTELGGLLAAVSTVWAHRLTANRFDGSSWVRLAPAVFTAACVVMAVAPAQTMFGRPTRPAALGIQLPIRMLLVLVVVAATFTTMPGWAAVATWPLAIALGGDAAVTAWSIGWNPTPLASYRQYLGSPVHLGIVGCLLGVLAIRGYDVGISMALPIYATFQVWVLVATLTAAWLCMLHSAEQAEHMRVAHNAASDEHRRAAHWLHDDICAELRFAMIRVQSRSVDLAGVESMLDNLDHRLRLRQLDELFESGSVRLAEILQPYVRRAQAVATICEVPAFEEASLIVGSEIGRLFSRAAAVLTSNALNASAAAISFAIEAGRGTISIAVTDDAGGFATKTLPPGRGLWTLQQDPNVQSVDVDDVPGGSRVRVTISLSERTARDPALAR